MINKIGIENFRVFKEYTEFEIAPITILTGPNNAGKSSLIKMLGLLKNSFGFENGINKLIFEGGNHNLGTFQNILNWDNKSKELKITLDFPLTDFDEKYQIELIYINEEKNENANLTSVKIFNSKRVLFKIFCSMNNTDYDVVEGDNDFYGFYTIDLLYLKDFFQRRDDLFFDYYINIDDKKELVNEKYQDFLMNFEQIFNSLIISFDPADGRGNWDFVTDWSEFILGVGEHDLSWVFQDLKLKSEKNNLSVFSRMINCYMTNNGLKEDSLTQTQLKAIDEFVENINNIKFRVNPKIREEVDNKIEKNFTQALKKVIYTIQSIEHLSVIRGNQKRAFSNKSISHIDSIVKDFQSRVHNPSFLKKCLKILGIKGELKIERREGVISFVYIKNGNRKTLLSDLGFGYSQLIPIILKIIILGELKEDESYEKNPYGVKDLPNKKPTKKPFIGAKKIQNKSDPDKKQSLVKFESAYMKIFEITKQLEKLTKYSILIIEEPEANLHPNFQSKIADILVLAQKYYNIKFILETHSEYLIRKLQYLTAKKEIGIDDVNIYYFNSDEYVTEKEKKVKKIEINEFGALTDSFGPGFFDEATKLQFDLLKLNKEQNN